MVTEGKLKSNIRKTKVWTCWKNRWKITKKCLLTLHNKGESRKLQLCQKISRMLNWMDTQQAAFFSMQITNTTRQIPLTVTDKNWVFIGQYPIKLICDLQLLRESHRSTRLLQLIDDGIMWLALRSVKSNNVDILNQIHYFSIK